MQDVLLQLQSILYAATRENWLCDTKGIPERHEDFFEFVRRAKSGDFNPVDFEREDPDELAASREPLGPVEFDYRKRMMLYRVNKSADRGRVAQLAMAISLGLLDRHLSGMDSIEAVNREIEALALMRGLSDQDCHVLESAFERFYAAVLPVISMAGPSPELDTAAMQQERAEYKMTYESYREAGRRRNAEMVVAAMGQQGAPADACCDGTRVEDVEEEAFGAGDCSECYECEPAF